MERSPRLHRGWQAPTRQRRPAKSRDWATWSDPLPRQRELWPAGSKHSPQRPESGSPARRRRARFGDATAASPAATTPRATPIGPATTVTSPIASPATTYQRFTSHPSEIGPGIAPRRHRPVGRTVTPHDLAGAAPECRPRRALDPTVVGVVEHRARRIQGAPQCPEPIRSDCGRWSR